MSHAWQADVLVFTALFWVCLDFARYAILDMNKMFMTQDLISMWHVLMIYSRLLRSQLEFIVPFFYLCANDVSGTSIKCDWARRGVPR